MTMDGRTISDAVNQQADIIPYMANDKIVVFIALLCGVIAIVGFLSVLPWGCILRLYDSYVAAKLANTGLKNLFIESLPSVVYSTARSEITDLVGDVECPICLAEFVEGQRLRVLPKCKHSFHVECVDKWFGSHSSCPTCRNCLLGREEDRDVQFQIQWRGSDDYIDEDEKQRRSPEITDIVVIN